MPAYGKRRAYGQHFLKDRVLCRSIATTSLDEAARAGASALLEIGPGKGALTEPLLEGLKAHPTIERLVLSERDPALAAGWKSRQGAQVEEGDFLELPESRWVPEKGRLAVVSNLPYSTGTAIFTRLARHWERIPIMVLMFQAEVAQRLRAEPRTKAWGSLSVWTQNRWVVEKLHSVPPGAFAPPPEVDSEVVMLKPRSQPFISMNAGEEALWESLLKAAFAHRRKMLRSGFPSGSPYKKALETSNLDGTKRAEALEWPEWKRLFEALRSL